MRLGLVGSSLLVISLTLGACDGRASPPPSSASPAGPQTSVQQGAWSADAARQLRAALDGRAVHGLDHMAFGIVGEPGSPEADAALTKTALAYAGALAHGASDPAKLYKVYTLARPQVDLEAGLDQALKANSLDQWLQGLSPQTENYKKLSDAYLALRKSAVAAPQPAIAAGGKLIKPGAADPRVPLIAAQLATIGYLPREAAQGNVYTPAMVAAVQRMQEDYGLKPDGVIGADALHVINQSDADRARALAVNMERLRWQDRNPPPTRIDVNLAAARLIYWRDGKVADVRNVVVGAPNTETPQLGSPIFRLVANPTWTVPKSIERKELASKGADYFAAHNMVRRNGWIVQQPGPKNSLGLVKFDMKNEHAIYLHDTPAKTLFREVERQRSHGCIRVEDALGFAEMIARDEGVADKWRAARGTGKETFVALPRQIPVRLLYQNVFFDPAGAPVVRSDPYGWNDRVAEALGFMAQTGRRLQTDGTDVGP